jgi:hypothetical protein
VCTRQWNDNLLYYGPRRASDWRVLGIWALARASRRWNFCFLAFDGYPWVGARSRFARVDRAIQEQLPRPGQFISGLALWCLIAEAHRLFPRSDACR